MTVISQKHDRNIDLRPAGKGHHPLFSQEELVYYRFSFSYCDIGKWCDVEVAEGRKEGKTMRKKKEFFFNIFFQLYKIIIKFLFITEYQFTILLLIFSRSFSPFPLSPETPTPSHLPPFQSNC